MTSPRPGLSRPPRRARRLLAGLLTAATALSLVGVASLTAPATAAPGAGTGGAGQSITVSDVDGLDPAGTTVTVTGAGFTEAAGFDVDTDGLYLSFCVDNGPGQTPTPCLGGVDQTGASTTTRWITNNGVPGQPALTVPIAQDGSFTTTLTVKADDGTTDCLDLAEGKECKIFTRRDHRGSADRSQDIRVPVSFATGPVVSLSQSTDLDAAGDTIVVTGSGFPTDGPGLYVVFGPVPQGNQSAAPFKPAAYVRAAAISPDGSWTATLTDVKARYTGSDGIARDFLNGGGHVSTFRAQGQPDPDGRWSTSTPVTFAVRSARQSFVTAARTDFIAPDPAVGDVDADVAALAAGQTKAQYLRALSTSDEWLAAVVNDLYQDTLGRDGDEAGVAYWVGELASGRRTVAQVAARFYASPEYFDGIGEGSVDVWIRDLYTKILGRSADEAGVEYWTGEVEAKGRGDVALRFYQTAESGRTRVAALYQSLLGRSTDAAGLAFWTPRVLAQGDLALAVSLAASAEYQTRAEARFP